jgi:hypothetical protein
MRKTRITRRAGLACLCGIVVLLTSLATWAVPPGAYDKVIFPVTSIQHVDLTIPQENDYEIYMAISGHCHLQDPYCADRQAWDQDAGVPMTGGGRILFKATDVHGVAANFVSQGEWMPLYFGYEEMPAADHRIPRPVAIIGETRHGHTTTFENGPAFFFINSGPTLVELPSVDVRGVHFLEPVGFAFGTETTIEDAMIDTVVQGCVIENVQRGQPPGTWYKAVALYLTASGTTVVTDNRVIRSDTDPTLPDMGVWLSPNSGPIYGYVAHNDIQNAALRDYPLHSISVAICAYASELGYTARNIISVNDNDLGEGVVAWTPNGAISFTNNRIKGVWEGAWLTTQEETALVFAHNRIELEPGSHAAMRVGIASFALGFHGGLISANRVSGGAEYGVYVEAGGHHGTFLANAMRGLETTAELFYFDETTHDNLVIGYTDHCNVTDLGTDNCVMGCNCWSGD